MHLEITVKPNAKKRAVTEGPTAGTYIVHTTKPATENKANKDVVDMLAEYFHIAKSRIEIVRGHTGRRKQIKIIAP